MKKIQKLVLLSSILVIAFSFATSTRTQPSSTTNNASSLDAYLPENSTLSQIFPDNDPYTQLAETTAPTQLSTWEKMGIALASYYFVCKEFFGEKVKPFFVNMFKKKHKMARLASRRACRRR